MMGKRRLNQCPLPEKEKKPDSTKNDSLKCENMNQARSIYQRGPKRRLLRRQSLRLLHNTRPRCTCGRSPRT